eukprot:5800468-Alexandrium_andersonii.AAC.1
MGRRPSTAQAPQWARKRDGLRTLRARRSRSNRNRCNRHRRRRRRRSGAAGGAPPCWSTGPEATKWPRGSCRPGGPPC